MKFIYTRINDEIRIDQIEDPEAVIYVPEQFEDCPVTELGSYVLAHSSVEEIHLPPYVRKIGAYGFYECEQLKRIYCYSRVLDLGAGLFAGVPAVEYLDITEFPGERSCLKEMLTELRQTLRVQIHCYCTRMRVQQRDFADASHSNPHSGSRVRAQQQKPYKTPDYSGCDAFSAGAAASPGPPAEASPADAFAVPGPTTWLCSGWVAGAAVSADAAVSGVCSAEVSADVFSAGVSTGWAGVSAGAAGPTRTMALDGL